MYKYKDARKCDICGDTKESVYHYDIYSFGSEGVVLCLDCIPLVIQTCEQDKFRVEMARIIENMAMKNFRERWLKKMAETED